jgi:hypothetical protein
MYANFGRPKSQFHIDYTLGYQRDNRQAGLSGTTHSGSLSWSRLLGRRGGFSVTDTVVSAANDYGTSVPQSSYQILDPYLLTQEIFVDRQRVIRNVLATSIGHQIGRRTTVAAFAAHEFTRYQRADFRQSHTVQVGVSLSHQLTRYMSIQTSYTTFVSKVNPLYRGASIQGLRALTFELRRKRFRVSTSGGVQSARQSRSHNIVADAEASLWVGSQSTGFSLTYNHGLTSIIGIGSALETDSLNLSVRHRLSDRFFVGLSSYYMHHGTRSESKSGFQSLVAGASIQTALTTGLVLSFSHNYISQNARHLAFDVPSRHRYASTATIHYLLPALRVR